MNFFQLIFYFFGVKQTVYWIKFSFCRDPAAIFDSDSLWRVEKGKRKCDSDSDGHIDLTRFVAPNGEGCVGDCIINGIISTPDPGNSTFDVPIFPSCTSNVKIEDHGWASLYLSSDFKPELGCGCGNWVDIPDNIKGACPSIGSAEVAFNNNGYECLIFDDDGKKIYP